MKDIQNIEYTCIDLLDVASFCSRVCTSETFYIFDLDYTRKANHEDDWSRTTKASETSKGLMLEAVNFNQLVVATHQVIECVLICGDGPFYQDSWEEHEAEADFILYINDGSYWEIGGKHGVEFVEFIDTIELMNLKI